MKSYKFYFGVFIVFFLLRNILMPLAQDDYSYSFIWEGDKGGNLGLLSPYEELNRRERVQSFSDILVSQYSHYFTWGGRVVAHCFVQFFLWIGKFYFDIANVAVLALLVVVIFKLANVSIKENPHALAWIFICILFFSQESIVTTLSLTGACNYLWMSLLQTSFLLPYVVAIRKGKVNDSALKIFLMAILGLAAGWSNESGALATVFLTTILVFWAKRKNSLSKYMVAGFITLIIGCAMDISAPGNFVQMNYIQSVSEVFRYSPQMLTDHFLYSFLPIIFIDLIVISPLIYYFFKKAFRKPDTNEILPLAFVLAGIVVPAAMIFSPKFDLRISLISMIFMLVAATWAFPKIKITIPYFKPVKIIFAAILIFYSATLIYSDWSLYKANAENLEYIRQHQNDSVVVMSPMNTSTKFESIQGGKIAAPWVRYFGGITQDENFYLNIMISQYYGIKGIVAKE